MPSNGKTVIAFEIDAPDHLALLSNYGVWNEIIDECVDANGDASRLDPIRGNWERVFDVNLRAQEPWGDWVNDDIQATLPLVEWSWARDLKTYQLPKL